MASTYTLNNGIELIGTGEQSGTWGDTTNDNLQFIDTALDGQVTITATSAGTSGSPNTLPIADGQSLNSEGRNRMVIITSATDLGSTVYYQLTPNDAEKIIYIRNDLNAQDLILFQGTYNSSNDYVVPNGTTAVIYFDGNGSGAVAANVFNNAYFDSLRLGSVSVTAILDEDDMSSDSATALATQQSIKAYVDTQITAEDLDFAGDSGTGAVDLDSQTFTIAGTTNEIETSASGQTLTIGLPDDVTIAGDLTVDTDTLYVDSTNDRVGINTDSPVYALHGKSSSAAVGIIESTAASSDFYFKDSGTTYNYSNGLGSVGDDLRFKSGDGSEAMRIDSSQRVLINTTTSRVVGGSAEAVTQIYNTSNGALLSLFRDQASNNGGAIIRGGKARNSAIVQDNDTIFSLEAVAHDGTDMGSFAGTIAFLVDGTPGANDTPSRIAFYTTADGSSSGTERMRIDSAGRVGIGGIDPSTFNSNANQLVISGTSNTGLTIDATSTTESNIFFADGADGTEAYRGIIRYAHSNDEFRFFTNGGSQAMTIDSSQRVLIGGQSDTLTVGGIAALLQVENTSGSAAISIARHTASVNSGYLNFGKSRGADATIVQEDDYTGFIQWAGADGTDINSYTAYISSAVDGTPGSNDMPGRLSFWTTADGASSPTERMRINSAGKVGIGGARDPSTLLDIASSGVNTEAPTFRITNLANIGDWSSTTTTGIIEFFSNDTSGNAPYRTAFIQSQNDFLSGTPTLPSGALVFGTTSYNLSGGAIERMRIASDGRVLIGSTQPRKNFWNSTVNPQFQIEAASDFGRQMAVISSSTNSGFGGVIIMAHEKSGTVGGNTISANGDTTGTLSFQGHDGTQFTSTASIDSQVDGTPGTNDMPGRLVFKTVADGATSATERMRLDNAGNLFVGKTGFGNNTAGHQIEASGLLRSVRANSEPALFNRTSSDGDIVTIKQSDNLVGSIGNASGVNIIYLAGQNSGIKILRPGTGIDGLLPCDNAGSNRDALMDLGSSGVRFKDLYMSGGIYLGGSGSSNKLDDYEEGTWTPSLAGSTTNPSLTYNTAAGAYEKIGAFVHASFFMNVGAVSSQGSGQLRISGLPFTTTGTVASAEVPAVLLQTEPFNDGDGSGRQQYARTQTNSTQLLMGYKDGNGGATVPTNAAANVGTGYLIGHIVYKTNS